MVASVIGAYEGLEGDCDQELEALGTAIGKRFFHFAQRVVSRQVDHWAFQTFDEYRDVPIYKAEFDECFTLFAVIDDGDEGIVMTLLLAARFGADHIGGIAWDGRDMDVVRTFVLLPRMQDYFE